MVAETIIKQLGGQGKITAMTGAYDFLKDGENSVMFKFKGSKKANYVKITLNSMDLYDMEFKKVKKMTQAKVMKWMHLSEEEMQAKMAPTNKKEYLGVYNDMLKDIFESHTGLYLSL